MKAIDLEKITGGDLIGRSDVDVGRFSIDSRKIRKGEVFIALKGERYDGHDFIKDAFSKGAVGVVSESSFDPPPNGFVLRVESTLGSLRKIAEYKRDTFKGRVVGVAGSVGKTTTKDMIHHLLSKVSRSYKSEGNLNSQIGLPLVLANMPTDVEYAVFELGASRRGDVLKLTELAKPSVRVITALGEEHLESFGTIKDVIEGNGEIFHRFDPSQDWAVIPKYAEEFYDLPRERVVTFGEGGDLSPEDIRLTPEGTRFTLGGVEFFIGVVSVGIVENALASLGVMSVLGYDPLDLRDALREFIPAEGRMRAIRFPDFTIIDDTYNANPPSVKNAIETLSRLKVEGKRVVVLGDMLELGEESEKLHREIGAYISRMGIDVGIFFGREMERAYEEAKMRGVKAMHFNDKDTLIEEVLKWAKDKNIILIKGSRGMQMEEVVRRVGG